MQAFRLVVLLFTALAATQAAAADSVAFAGFAYAGDAQQIAARFPVTRQVEAELTASGGAPNKAISRSLAARPPANFSLSSDGMASLKHSDQALATALVVTSETISSERFGRLYKVLANVRGQALVFDFKAMTVLRAYPINVTYLDVLDHQPSEREKRDRVKRLLLGGDRKSVV